MRKVWAIEEEVVDEVTAFEENIKVFEETMAYFRDSFDAFLNIYRNYNQLPPPGPGLRLLQFSRKARFFAAELYELFKMVEKTVDERINAQKRDQSLKQKFKEIHNREKVRLVAYTPYAVHSKRKKRKPV